MITEDYVSFEVAKLLQEKGFDGQCKMKYNQEGTMLHHVPGPTDLMFTTDKKEIERHSMKNHIEYFLCPTLQMAMKWLREVHKIIITIDYNEDSDCEDNERYGFSVYYLSRKVDLATYVTYEQACEAAIMYCLKNFI